MNASFSSISGLYWGGFGMMKENTLISSTICRYTHNSAELPELVRRNAANVLGGMFGGNSSSNTKTMRQTSLAMNLSSRAVRFASYLARSCRNRPQIVRFSSLFSELPHNAEAAVPSPTSDFRSHYSISSRSRICPLKLGANLRHDALECFFGAFFAKKNLIQRGV